MSQLFDDAKEAFITGDIDLFLSSINKIPNINQRIPKSITRITDCKYNYMISKSCHCSEENCECTNRQTLLQYTLSFLLFWITEEVKCKRIKMIFHLLLLGANPYEEVKYGIRPIDQVDSFPLIFPPDIANDLKMLFRIISDVR